MHPLRNVGERWDCPLCFGPASNLEWRDLPAHRNNWRNYSDIWVEARTKLLGVGHVAPVKRGISLSQIRDYAYQLPDFSTWGAADIPERCLPFPRLPISVRFGMPDQDLVGRLQSCRFGPGLIPTISTTREHHRSSSPDPYSKRRKLSDNLSSQPAEVALWDAIERAASFGVLYRGNPFGSASRKLQERIREASLADRGHSRWHPAGLRALSRPGACLSVGLAADRPGACTECLIRSRWQVCTEGHTSEIQILWEGAWQFGPEVKEPVLCGLLLSVHLLIYLMAEMARSRSGQGEATDLACRG